MDLRVSLARVEMKRRGNFFVMVQMEELTFPEKEKKANKYRTEISINDNFPMFQKSVFNFRDMSLGSRLTLKLGVFTTKADVELKEAKLLSELSKLEGSCTIVFTQSMIGELREKDTVTRNFKFIHPDSGEEVGVGILDLSFRANSFDQRLVEDRRKIESVYYDVFEDDDYVIGSKVKEISKMLVTKQTEFEKTINQLDMRRESLRSLGTDLALLKKQKDSLEGANVTMRKKITKLQSIDDLHLKIDMLIGSKQGNELLQKMLTQMALRIKYEKADYEKLKDDYFQIEPKVNKFKALEKQLKGIQDAGKEQDFHIKRCEDQIPSVLAQKETIKSHENIIKNLQKMLYEEVAATKEVRDPVLEKEQLYLKEQLILERDQLKEKHKQLKAMLDMNGGQVTAGFLEQMKEESYLENKEEIDELKGQQNSLMEEIERLSHRLREESVRNVDKEVMGLQERMTEEKWQEEKVMWEIQLREYENRAQALESEVERSARQYAHEMADLKMKKAQLEAVLSTMEDREGGASLSLESTTLGEVNKGFKSFDPNKTYSNYAVSSYEEESFQYEGERR